MLWALSASADAFTIGPDDNHRSLNFEKGDTIVIRLPANASTGYSWTVQHTDAAILLPIGKPAYVGSGNKPGAGGTTTFKFKTVGNGKVLLTLVYKRPFGPKEPAAQTWECFCKVGDQPEGKAILVSFPRDNNGKVALGKGDVLTVRLPADPSRGLFWGMTLPKQLHMSGIPDYDRRGKSQVFRFTANQPGQGTLLMTSRGESKPRKFKMSIIVKRHQENPKGVQALSEGLGKALPWKQTA